MKSTSTEPIVFQQAYDLTQWYAQRTPGFPKTHRFTLGDRLEHTLFDLLTFLQDAAYGKNRAVVLSKAQDQVDRLRLWNRLARDLKCISPKQYTYAAERIEEIGRQIGGWTRSSRVQGAPARATDGTARRTGPRARCLRGGSWNNNDDNTRSANRNRNQPTNRNNNNGFRVASRKTLPMCAEAGCPRIPGRARRDYESRSRASPRERPAQGRPRGDEYKTCPGEVSRVSKASPGLPA